MIIQYLRGLEVFYQNALKLKQKCSNKSQRLQTSRGAFKL